MDESALLKKALATPEDVSLEEMSYVLGRLVQYVQSIDNQLTALQTRVKELEIKQVF